MKSYKIAVCLSGEPRTWNHCSENILEFFKSDIHDIKFFGHTWTDSEYTKEHRFYGIEKCESYPKDELYQNMISAINYEKLLIEDKTVIDVTPIPSVLSFDECTFGMKVAANLAKPTVYVHMSYSIMQANWLKTMYEIENDMRFDLVVRARHDSYYTPGTKFEDYLPGRIEPTAIYGSTNTFPMEYWQNHFTDVLFFGSSRVMNTVCDFYRYYSTGKFWELLDANWNDPYIKICGYNVCLYKWLMLKNIRVQETNLIFNTYIFRKKAAELYSLPQDADAILQVERNLFR